MAMDYVDIDPSTWVVSSGRPPAVPDNPINTPIVSASTFHAGGAIEYGREANPSASALEEALGGLEGGDAIVFSSGMAGANALMDLWPIGAKVIAPTTAYTGVAVRLRELHVRGQIELTTCDVTQTQMIVDLLPDSQVLWLESPTNPLLEVAELEKLLAHARNCGVTTIVDNTFASPVRQNPLAMGADFVLHSVTKILSVHSDLLMGAVIAKDRANWEQLRVRRVLLGAMPGAFDCYLALRGLRTLFIRYEKSEENAIALASRLESHPNVLRLRYPGWGTIAAIEVSGSADRVCELTRLWTYATSLGGVESLLERRRRWPLESHTVPENLIRLSFGIEHPEDLWSDLNQALLSG
jgi:cystathionine gamma-synthase